MWSAVLFGAVAALFLTNTIVTLLQLRWVRPLPPLSLLPGSIPGPHTRPTRCSVVLAARDEEARVEATVLHLLAQRGIDVEVIVVDDRSADRTGAIVQRLALADPRVRALRVDLLPDGWLGKCHACHVGALAATGGWILFTDADCWLTPDVIARALRVADRDAADHITMTPGVDPHGLAARATHLVFLTTLVSWIAGVNRDRPRAYVGMGAFNLVRATAYRDCGGYEALRLTILDDVRLGLLLRRAGRRTRAFIGGADVQCEWGRTMRGTFRLVEKNYFAAVDFRVDVVVAAALGGGLLFGSAVIGPWTGTVMGWAAAVGALSMVLPAMVVARRLGWSIASGALTPFLYPGSIVALVNSAFVTVRQGGVRWRDTFYPLDALRKGRVH